MSWINTLRTSAEDFGTLGENEPPTKTLLISHKCFSQDAIRETLENSETQSAGPMCAYLLK